MTEQAVPEGFREAVYQHPGGAPCARYPLSDPLIPLFVPDVPDLPDVQCGACGTPLEPASG